MEIGREKGGGGEACAQGRCESSPSASAPALPPPTSRPRAPSGPRVPQVGPAPPPAVQVWPLAAGNRATSAPGVKPLRYRREQYWAAALPLGRPEPQFGWIPAPAHASPTPFAGRDREPTHFSLMVRAQAPGCWPSGRGVPPLPGVPENWGAETWGCRNLGRGRAAVAAPARAARRADWLRISALCPSLPPHPGVGWGGRRRGAPPRLSAAQSHPGQGRAREPELQMQGCGVVGRSRHRGGRKVGG